MHHNTIVHNYNATRAWATSLIVETLFFWAVPVFLMITGTNLMRYREKYDTKTFFKKRFTKVIIPFIFWIAVTLLWRIFILKNIETSINIKWIINAIFSNKIETTYYFVFIILGIYLTLPLLSNLANEKYRNALWYTVGIYFVFNSFLPVIFDLIGISYNGYLTIQIGDYLIFVILGYLLSTAKIDKKKRIIIYTLGILSAIFRYSITYYFTLKTGVLYRNLFYYPQFHSILLASAVFLFIKNINYEHKFFNKKVVGILKNMSSCSFGIYLIHKIVMHYEIILLGLDIHSWVWRTIATVITYIISFIIIYILKKVPYIKNIVS